ncbi:OTU-like cysteine protease [Plasmodium gonderi]|uniref:OTU-like cysteine protease n=1 Tax=Plasmodium gonderi TaxID=77519 RepID=A0A1Y1JJS8_PLAGO|nr:OTU-like cysteine protease [Plasmodium gonderi]GAW80294.1 OTU-like cysteine protease [Plasmodium gonderi]
MNFCCGVKLSDLKYEYMKSRLNVLDSYEKDEILEKKLRKHLNIKSLAQTLSDVEKLKQREQMRRYSTFDRRISFLKRSSIIDKTNFKCGKKVLETRLASIDCELINVTGDGNCLFRSISWNLFDKQKYHMYVRKRCVEHMLNCKQEFSIYFENNDFYDYLKKMSKDGYWGDELSIKATADAFDCIVYIITSTAENWHLKYEPKYKINNEHKKCIFLAYTSPTHYDSFKPIRR